MPTARPPWRALILGAVGVACAPQSPPAPAASPPASSLPAPSPVQASAAVEDPTLATAAMQVEGMRIKPAVVSEVLPVFYSRDACPFPGRSTASSAGRPPTLAALTYLAGRARAERRMFVAVQRDPTTAEPTPGDLHTVGIIVTVSRIKQHAQDHIEYEMTGVERARLIAIDTSHAWHAASIQHLDSTGKLTPARAQELSTWLALDDRRFRDKTRPVRPRKMSDSAFVDHVVDQIASYYIDNPDRAALLQEVDIDRRATLLMEIVDAAVARLSR